VIYEFGFVMRLYFFNYDVMVCIWFAISNPHVLHVENVLPCLKAIGGIS